MKYVKLSPFDVFQRVREYFDQRNITNPTEDQLNMARELIFQLECTERERKREKAEREKAEGKADFWMKNATRNEEQRVSQNISLISSIRSLK